MFRADTLSGVCTYVCTNYSHLVFIASHLAADIVAVCHVWVQDVRVEELKVGQLGSKEAALQEVDVGHVRDVPHTPGEPNGI